ncbi:AAA domain-containing protein [Nocardia sp. NPDC023852]|uniref:caspase, EACC1-associated type n=1 Tax=Nocardia sp. NPDC023852 TaxID=3154697 RepID=UPI0033CFEDB7
MSSYTHPDLPDIPAAATNVADLLQLLRAPAGAALAVDHCTPLVNPGESTQVGTAVHGAAQDARDVMLLYYTGHGVLDRKGRLHLALPNSEPNQINWSSIPFDRLREELAASRARARILILDCCFSGRAFESMSSASTLVDGQIDIHGTYTITSSSRNEPSLAPGGHRHTAFTAALLEAAAIPGLTLDELYQNVERILVSKGHPGPQRRSVNSAGVLRLFTPFGVRPVPSDNASVVPMVDPHATPNADTEALFEDGLRFADQGDLVAAEDSWLRAAMQGHVGAMNNLANLLHERGKLRDAHGWYRQAAERGNADAMGNLANLLHTAHDGDAQRWWVQAAEAGNTDAMYNLAIMLDKTRYFDAALAWYQRAAKAGHADAMHNLAIRHRARGQIAEASFWWQRAGHQGSQRANEKPRGPVVRRQSRSAELGVRALDVPPTELPGIENGGARGQVPPAGCEDTWNWVKQKSLAGVEALIERQQQIVPLKAVSNSALELPSKPWLAVDTVPQPRAGWSEQMFFLVDADTAGGSARRRHPVFLKYPPKARRVVVKVTARTRAELGSVRRVRLLYLDTQDLGLLRQLQACLGKATRAPRVADMWSQRTLGYVPAVDGLNPEQAQAFSAMTAGGGWLVWGPPGTGKTTVIVKAVEEALAMGRSVLIASHTHVAVDNVVKDLTGVVDEAGAVVRVGNHEKIDPEVVAHQWLMLDKAAAALTDREARLKEILEQQQVNRNHQARRQLDSVINRLAETDLELIKRAYAARGQAIQHKELEVQYLAQNVELVERQQQIRDITAMAAEHQKGANKLPGLRIQQVESREGVGRIDSRINDQEAKVSELVGVRDALRSDLARLSRQVQGSSGELDEQFDSTLTAVSRMGKRIVDSETELDEIRAQRAAAQKAVEEFNEPIAVASRALHQANSLRRQVEELTELQNQLEQAMTRLGDEMTQVKASVDAVGNYEEVIAEAERQGIAALESERDELNDLVGRLDDQLKELDKDKRRLDDEYAGTKRQLLESAPVIACTLTALTIGEELVNRRFDTVIIDEAASAQIGQLIYAGSKADRCLAYVGDFLQNAPITDTDDAITEEQQQLLPWQRADIFGLLGISDRATAESHPRCIALRTQFRYPPVIADIVNQFCYDGLLLTSWTGRVDNPVVTFIDTSDHPDQGLRSNGESSWLHPLGLRLLEPVYQRRGTNTIGMVCPYRAHAERATDLARDRGLDMSCGTSHLFQGRQFDTVIVDLMQDAHRPRWAALADLAGDERQVSAARLLNVAITRAKRRLYLIGDWNFVRRSTSPGLKAIAGLVGRPEFNVIHANEVLSGT